MASVIVQSGPEMGRTFNIPEGGIILGRAAGPSCDIALGGPSVSSRHARIYFDAGRASWFVRDLGSVNGTLVDGRPVDLAELQEGAKLCFSEIEVIFSLEEGSAQVAQPASSSPDDTDWGGGAGIPAGPQSGGSEGAVDLGALRANAGFLKSVSQGADLALDTFETEIAELRRAMAMRDPTQAHLAVARVIDSGKLEACLSELRNIRQAEVGVLESMEELLG
jgi:pSer/pThr/pTyr-binding forkhead associated (FHA) protein